MKRTWAKEKLCDEAIALFTLSILAYSVSVRLVLTRLRTETALRRENMPDLQCILAASSLLTA